MTDTDTKLIRMLLEHFLEIEDPVEYTRYEVQRREVFAEEEHKHGGSYL